SRYPGKAGFARKIRVGGQPGIEYTIQGAAGAAFGAVRVRQFVAEPKGVVTLLAAAAADGGLPAENVNRVFRSYRTRPGAVARTPGTRPGPLAKARPAPGGPRMPSGGRSPLARAAGPSAAGPAPKPAPDPRPAAGSPEETAVKSSAAMAAGRYAEFAKMMD